MTEETKKIENLIKVLIKQARQARTMECQNQCMTGFIYYQGIIDSLTDTLFGIGEIKEEAKRLNGGQEVE